MTSPIVKFKSLELRSPIEITDSPGDRPFLIARFTKHSGAVVIGYLVFGFIMTAWAGIPALIMSLITAYNDLNYLNKENSPSLGDREEMYSETESLEDDDPEVQTPPRRQHSTALQETTSSSSGTRLVSTSRIPQFPIDKIITESKGLMICGDMGSAKTSVALYVVSHFHDYQVIVFDPHEDDEKDWGNAERYCDIEEIFKAMQMLLDLLDDRDKSKIFIFADEWLEIRCDKRNKRGGTHEGVADDFIRLFSTKARKFNKVASFIMHSHNVEKAGVDSNLRANYQMVYLGNIARKVMPGLKECAYPCVVGDTQCEHPTHGHHEVFRPKGNAPREVSRISSGGGKLANWSSEPQKESGKSLSPTDALEEPLRTIWVFAKGQEDWITVREVMRKDFKVLKGKTAEQTRRYFGLLADSEWGDTEDGSSDSSTKFRAN